MEKQYYVYILANKRNGTLYTGMTSDLVKRVWQHRNSLIDSFTKTYHVKLLVYFQVHQPMRLRHYTVFDREHDYFDDHKNAAICRKVANKCYLPANRLCNNYLLYFITGILALGLTFTNYSIFLLFLPARFTTGVNYL